MSCNRLVAFLALLLASGWSVAEGKVLRPPFTAEPNGPTPLAPIHMASVQIQASIHDGANEPNGSHTRPNAALSRQLNSASVASDCEANGCSHTCETVGEFPLCVCPPDMVLDDDGKTCKETPSFLLAMFRGIRLYQEGSGEELTVAPVKVHSLDFHYSRQEVYAYSNYSIMRYPISKGKTASPVSTVTKTDTSVTSLAVDWAHNGIYYISEQQSKLSMTPLDTKDTRTILTHNGSSSAEWSSLVVDPYAKRLFWIGSQGVYSSSLDGKDVNSGLISWIKPDKIALDTNQQLIYAIGRRGISANKYIARANYDGTKVGDDVEIPQPVTSVIYGFGIARNIAYWESNHDGENLYKCDLTEATNKATVTLVADLNQIVYDMKVYHQDVQKPHV